MIVDLHTHSTVSDGTLTPPELLHRARSNGVNCLSITDHDTVGAYQELAGVECADLSLIPGIELSAAWASLNIHIVGLNVDLQSPVLHDAVCQQQRARLRRAQQIDLNLRKLGISGTLDGARGIAGSDNIGRPHFAAYLVESGAAGNTRQAFRKYLGRGKAGDVREFWPSLAVVVRWIREAAGTAVLAHPAHYQLTNTRLGRLADEFIAAGGTAIEVVSGRQAPDVTRKLANLATEKDLLASCGSDFHRPGQAWAELGQGCQLPAHCRAVWQGW